MLMQKGKKIKTHKRIQALQLHNSVKAVTLWLKSYIKSDSDTSLPPASQEALALFCSATEHNPTQAGFFLWKRKDHASKALTCKDLPCLLFVVVVLNQITGEAVGTRGQASNQQEHPFVWTNPVLQRDGETDSLTILSLAVISAEQFHIEWDAMTR